MAKKKKPTPRPAKTRTLLVRGAQILTVNDSYDVLNGDILVEDGLIKKIAPRIAPRGVDEVLEAKGLVLMPGFVQAHIHLCQTLFRGQADDMELLPWLRERIWPFEGALEAEDLRASARLGIAELLLGGTTAILDMGTVRHSDVLFEEALKMGLRYTGGKTLMDMGHGYPAGLRESTADALAESIRLCERWHGKAEGRLRYAFSPRFVLSCSEEAISACVREARARGALLHTHASENPEEVDIVQRKFGMGNIEYLHSLGFSGPDVMLAHCVWLNARERQLLRENRTRVVHCPSANLKLASGIARVAELLDEDIHVALGADGAACNNTLDGFMEMRLAALLHKIKNGPTAVPARRALRLATRDGALALGLDDAGAIAEGHKADFIVLDLNKPHAAPDAGDLHSRVVYSAKSSDVHSVVVDGRVVVNEGALLAAKVPAILKAANEAALRVRKRVGEN